MEKMKGIFPALVTPLREDGSIAQDALEKIIEVNLQKGVTGFCGRQHRRILSPFYGRKKRTD